MSRPYIQINSMSYATASSVLTMNYTFYKLRVQPAAMVITGFSGSVVSFNEVNANSDYVYGINTETLTFSVAATQSSGTYNMVLRYPSLGNSATYRLTF